MLLVMLLLVVLGLPLMVMGQLIQSRGMGPATRGMQPGGQIGGSIVNENDSPLANVSVDVYLVGEQVSSEPATRTTTSGDGSFLATVPKVDGCYLLKVGGGDWRLETREYSFLDNTGESVEEPLPLSFELHHGCTLQVSIKRSPGRPVHGGKAELQGTWRPSSLLNLVPLRVVRRETFTGGELRIDGLPPLTGTVHVEFGEGDELEFAVELDEEGDTQRLEFVLGQ
ncbi:MAG: hypothetical protein ACI8QC_000531 [Planctomycetota bacterium]|jgi:hypothetical protein